MHLSQRRNANPGGDMKITSKQLEALYQQQNQTSGVNTAQTAQSGSFEAALVEQLELENATSDTDASVSTTGQTTQASMISQMLLGTSDVQTDSQNSDVIQSAFTQASDTLDKWDSYVNALDSSEQSGSLREAYSLLQDIGDQVSSLKANTESVRGQNSGLDSLVNELDVMSTTEMFKFNRGDYSV
jgi:hypothetical protein